MESVPVPPRIFVFLTGASVMATEMCASRFIAPWFGSSMIVWSVLISVVMAAMSLGYWYGGRLADRKPRWDILYMLPVITGVFISLIPFAGRMIFSGLSAGIRGTPVNIIVLSLAGILIVFVPPVFVLAMVSPFTVKLLAKAENTGRTAGSLYAVSTLGSIAGTLLPSLVTIPLLGTKETMFLSSAILILLGSSGLQGKKKLAILSVLLPLTGWLISGHAVKPGVNVAHEEESIYQYLQVQRLENGSTRLVVNEGGAMQSIARENDRLNPASTYYESYLMLPYMLEKPDSARVLVIGAGAGTIPHWLAVHVRPALNGLEIDAVEIDRRATELGYEWFGSAPEDAEVFTADGRMYLSATEEKYDVIITDTYSNQVYIPFHMTTEEYFSQVRNHLNPGGILAVNVNGLNENSELVQSMGRTVGSVFSNSYIFQPGGAWNFMIMASDTPLTAPPADSFPSWNPVLEHTAFLMERDFKPFNAESGMLLTDNRAPVEFMTDQMILGEVTGYN
ncbi:hypothetical protein CSA37_05680 [Candidatus Fermentibacteria bacterium]|nr:MAG: hypothetical protein CSA37_05680 [Candidatus Fermentibacteria bacterium]